MSDEPKPRESEQYERKPPHERAAKTDLEAAKEEIAELDDIINNFVEEASESFRSPLTENSEIWIAKIRIRMINGRWRRLPKP